jgi:NADH-quinone oxidoreductase subunit C
MMMEENRTVKRLLAAYKKDIAEVYEFRGEINIRLKKGTKAFFKFLHDDEELSYDMLIDLTAVDYYEKSPRFEIVYLLHSMKFANRIRIKIGCDEAEEIETVSDIWRSAEWLEREVYDMFGIRFRGHPDLRRILLTDDFEGHPLKKDFPVEGYDFDKPFEVKLEEGQG